MGASASWKSAGRGSNPRAQRAVGGFGGLVRPSRFGRPVNMCLHAVPRNVEKRERTSERSQNIGLDDLFFRPIAFLRGT